MGIKFERLHTLGPADKRAFQTLVQKRVKEGEKVARTFHANVTVTVYDRTGASVSFTAHNKK